MKEIPIIFSTNMVRAIQEGRKTQTRRVTGLEFINERPDVWVFAGLFDSVAHFDIKAPTTYPHPPLHNLQRIKCPYGQVGDRLWVRETFCDYCTEAVEPKSACYKACPEQQPAMDVCQAIHWQPSIFMPRWASRITLEITEIRVERLQEIIRANAIAEGYPYYPDYNVPFSEAGYDGQGLTMTNEIDWFHKFWDSLNAKRGYGWEANPWVWVISFVTGVRLK